MGDYAFPGVGANGSGSPSFGRPVASARFTPHPGWTGSNTPVADRAARDLSTVADHFDVAATHLQWAQMTAGTELTMSALQSYRSLVGEVDPPLARALGEEVLLVLIGVPPTRLIDSLRSAARDIRLEIAETPAGVGVRPPRSLAAIAGDLSAIGEAMLGLVDSRPLVVDDESLRDLAADVRNASQETQGWLTALGANLDVTL